MISDATVCRRAEWRRRLDEIHLSRHFYKNTPPQLLETIDTELKQAAEETMRLLAEMTT